MKQQIVTIHGGETFGSYDAYITWLKSYKFDPERLIKKKFWPDTLEERLGEGYQVLSPRLPNNLNAKYLEWKILFEKMIPYFDDNIIFIGSSLGGIFLAKYLSENKYPKNIKALFMIAAPYDKVSPTDDMADFVLLDDLSRLAAYGNKVYMYHSIDDPVVPFSHLADYKKKLPKANIRELDGRGHFKIEEFPELVKDIQSL